jgi:hypothetical protein
MAVVAIRTSEWECPLMTGEFNQSTQHYSPKLSGMGLKFLH